MRMVLEDESRIRLEMAGEGFEITAEDISISPYHLLAGSLASCIALVMAPWAERSAIDMEPLTISIDWERAEDGDHRVSCLHRRNPVTDSDRFRSVIPREPDHRFRSKPVTLAGSSEWVTGMNRNRASKRV